MKKKLFLLLTLIFLTLQPTSAKVENDFQEWSLITVNKDLNDKFGLYFELQNRLIQNWTQEGLLFIRPAIKYKLNNHSSLWQGYDWVPNFSGNTILYENRIWQQIDYQKQVKNYDLFAWMRLEERLLEGTGGASIRNRIRVGFKHPLFNSKSWKWIAFDELWINLNNVHNGPSAGIDQNWVFAGLEKTFNDTVSLNFGYLLNYLNRDVDQLQHAVRVHLNINL